MMMLPLEEIFYQIDNFFNNFEKTNNQSKYLLPKHKRQRAKKSKLTLSEIATIEIMFKCGSYNTFKDFYINQILKYHKKDFNNLVSYNRIVELKKYVIIPLLTFLQMQCKTKTGFYFIDSTKLSVSHNARIRQHKTFKDTASRSKTSTGWFFGFKLHLITNNRGEIISFKLTSGKNSDLSAVESLSKNLQGYLVGDRGYISQELTEKLATKNLKLVTNARKNMKPKNHSILEKKLLSKRRVIETTIGQLKGQFGLEHSRHRSVFGFISNIISSIGAYFFKPKKVSVSFSEHVLSLAV